LSATLNLLIRSAEVSKCRLLQWLVSLSSMWPQILMIVDRQESAHLHIAEINTDFVRI